MVDFDELVKIQRNIASRLVSEDRTDTKIKLYELIRSFNKNRVQIEQIIIEAKYSGFSEDETLSLLNELESDGYLKNKDGYVVFD